MMKEKIHIRQAELQDLDAIERIELENFSEEEAIAREILKDHIEKIQTTFLVVECQGQILGYLEGPVRPERYSYDIIKANKNKRILFLIVISNCLLQN